MPSLKNEISSVPPDRAPIRSYVSGNPILYAFDCALLERETEKGFVYTAVNLKSNKSVVLSRRRNPLSPQNVNSVVERIRSSKIAGASRFGADRPYGEHIVLKKAAEIMDGVFLNVLPEYGYNVRAEQASLAKHILNTIYNRHVSLAEAEVGTGKTLAYLIPAILAKRGRLNDFWNRSFYPNMQYADMKHMPIVIATSSIALQKAIHTEYIPELSRMLTESGIIREPLTSSLRKGKEHYVCEHRLREHSSFEADPKMRKILKYLLDPATTIDVADVDGLTAHVKRKIVVPPRCFDDCRYRDSCPYLKFRADSESPEIDIQICNHNYILADTLRRVNLQRPLIPNYQTLIIDEAHKLLSTARSMYGASLSADSASALLKAVVSLNFTAESAQKNARRAAKKLADLSGRLFDALLDSVMNDDADDDAERFAVEIDSYSEQCLRKIRDMSDGLAELIKCESVIGHGAERKSQIIWGLEQIRDRAAALVKHSGLICWLETDDSTEKLCSIPRDLDAHLFFDLWSRGVPTILTSGTLSAGGDFSHIKRTLGLGSIGMRLTETSKASPFDHKKNALLYISESVPFPNQSDRAYIDAVSDETERLVCAAHGHAAILFTSYKVMDMVWERLSKRGLQFPLFRLNKGDINAIERFKRSGNGVLFASGAMWEGVDIPGDALSMLIIVKLPFAVPDPIGEYEQSLYSGMSEYKERVIVPEMLIKLRQGFGRLIRKETDTGIVAILDSRAAMGGSYRGSVLNALPECRITAEISELEKFIAAKKDSAYFD